MSDSKHTEGVWRAVRSGSSKVLVIEADGLPLLRMYAGRNEENNARLIAAAPDLLGLLKRAQEELRLLHLKDTGNIYDSMLRFEMSAAIAKAEGWA